MGDGVLKPYLRDLGVLVADVESVEEEKDFAPRRAPLLYLQCALWCDDARGGNGHVPWHGDNLKAFGLDVECPARSQQLDGLITPPPEFHVITFSTFVPASVNAVTRCDSKYENATSTASTSGPAPAVISAPGVTLLSSLVSHS